MESTPPPLIASPIVATIVGAAASAAILWLARRRAWRFIAASVPFWVFASNFPWMMYAALVLTIGGMAIVGIGPTLRGRRKRRDVAPLPHLANGPIVSVAPRVFFAARRSRAITIATWIFAVLTPVLLLTAAWASEPDVMGALALSSAIIAGTFRFSNWFAGRVRLRVDEIGVHSRVMFGDHTIRWTDVAGLSLRYFFMPGSGLRMVYYCVYSPTREVSFPSSMDTAADLRQTIEQATGLQWPAPEITPNF